MRTFDKDNAPFIMSGAKMYRKMHLTQAVRIDGPFRVNTKEGPLDCEDGYLALDSAGWPYPIAAGDFEAMYTED